MQIRHNLNSKPFLHIQFTLYIHTSFLSYSIFCVFLPFPLTRLHSSPFIWIYSEWECKAVCESVNVNMFHLAHVITGDAGFFPLYVLSKPCSAHFVNSGIHKFLYRSHSSLSICHVCPTMLFLDADYHIHFSYPFLPCSGMRATVGKKCQNEKGMQDISLFLFRIHRPLSFCLLC